MDKTKFQLTQTDYTAFPEAKPEIVLMLNKEKDLEPKENIFNFGLMKLRVGFPISVGYYLLAIDPIFWEEGKLMGLLMITSLMLQREADWLGGAFIIGAFFANKADNLIGLFLGVELLSLSTVLAVARGKPGRPEEGLKYLVLSAIFSGFFILGSAMILWAWGTMGLEEIRVLMDTERAELSTKTRQSGESKSFGVALFPQTYAQGFTPESPPLEQRGGGFILGMGGTLEDQSLAGGVGILILVTGLIFKLGGAPFHRWPLELYTKAENQGFLMVVSKLCWVSILGTQIINRGLVGTEVWGGLAVASLVVGAIGGLKEKKVRRILVWSSVNGLGYLILALNSGPSRAENKWAEMSEAPFFNLGVKGGPVLDGAEIYVVVYFISSLLVWLSLTPSLAKQREPVFPFSSASRRSFFKKALSVRSGLTPFLLAFEKKEEKEKLSQKLTLKEAKETKSLVSKEASHYLPNIREEPLKGILAITGLLALAGVPPFWGFVPKVWLLYCLVEQGSIGIALIVGLCSVFSGYYYFRLALHVMDPTILRNPVK